MIIITLNWSDLKTPNKKQIFLVLIKNAKVGLCILQRHCIQSVVHLYTSSNEKLKFEIKNIWLTIILKFQILRNLIIRVSVHWKL